MSKEITGGGPTAPMTSHRAEILLRWLYEKYYEKRGAKADILVREKTPEELAAGGGRVVPANGQALNVTPNDLFGLDNRAD